MPIRYMVEIEGEGGVIEVSRTDKGVEIKLGDKKVLLGPDESLALSSVVHKYRRQLMNGNKTTP